MKLSTIIAEIHNMESKDLNKVVEAVKYARSQAHRQMANTLRSGDTVNSTASMVRLLKVQ